MPDPRRVLLLSRNPEAHAIGRFQQAAEARGIALTLADPHQLELTLDGSTPGVRLGGEALDPAQWVVLPRIGSLSTEYSLAALEQLELAGFAVLNPSAGLHKLRNKFNMLGYLAAAGLPVPDSILLRAPAELDSAVGRLGGYPLVLKFIRGSQGLGVVYADNPTVAESVLEAMNYAQYDVLLQRYYPAAAGSDMRVLVLGGQARWAVTRTAQVGQFRSNIHRGGSSEALALDEQPELATLAERAATAFGLGFAGVDIVDGDAGPLVLEVNSSPGFETAEPALGADIAGAILEHVLTLG